MNKPTFYNCFLELLVTLASVLLFQADGLAQFGIENAPRVTATGEFQMKSGSKTEGVVSITATVVEGFHIYSVTQKKGGPLPTVISLVDLESGIKFGDFTPDQPAEIHQYEAAYGDLDIEEHRGKITWTAALTFESPVTDPASSKLRLQISSLACTDDLGICVPQKNEVIANYNGELEAISSEVDAKKQTEEPMGDPATTELGASPFNLGGGFESPGLGGGFESPGVASNNEKIEGAASYYVNPETGKGVVRVAVTVTEGFHIYSLTQKRGGPLPTILKVTGEGVQVSGPVVSDSSPEIHHYEVYGDLDVEEVKGTVNWDVPILGPPGDPTGLEIKVIVDALACTDDLGICVPQKLNFSAKLDVSLANIGVDLSSFNADKETPKETTDSGDAENEREEMSLIAVLGFVLS